MLWKHVRPRRLLATLALLFLPLVLLLEGGPGGDPAKGDPPSPAGGDPGAGGDPAKGDPPSPAGGDPGAGGDPAKGDPDKAAEGELGEAGKKALAAERTARQAAERDAKAAQAKLKQLEDEKLSETERKDKRLAELETKESDATRELQEERTARAFERAAAKAGAVDPEDAWRLVPLTQVTYDDEGRPTNVTELVEELKKSKPHMFGKPAGATSVDGGARPTPPGGFDPKDQVARIKEQTSIT